MCHTNTSLDHHLLDLAALKRSHLPGPGFVAVDAGRTPSCSLEKGSVKPASNDQPLRISPDQCVVRRDKYHVSKGVEKREGIRFGVFDPRCELRLLVYEILVPALLQ